MRNDDDDDLAAVRVLRDIKAEGGGDQGRQML